MVNAYRHLAHCPLRPGRILARRDPDVFVDLFRSQSGNDVKTLVTQLRTQVSVGAAKESFLWKHVREFQFVVREFASSWHNRQCEHFLSPPRPIFVITHCLKNIHKWGVIISGRKFFYHYVIDTTGKPQVDTNKA